MLSFGMMFKWNSIRLSIGARPWLLISSLLVIVLGASWFLLNAITTLPNFSQYPAGPDRKLAFFEFIRPLVETGNQAIQDDRQRLLEIANRDDPGWFERRFVARLARDYDLDNHDLDKTELIDQLLLRVDSVPLSLALAQAAKESGWGTSRFARDGNNLFGEWCFDKGCGIVPAARAPGATHEVESFFSPARSVASYLRNINSHPKYADFRDARARLRSAGQAPSGSLLAEFMSQYSERRDAYVQELVQLIRTNGLHELDKH